MKMNYSWNADYIILEDVFSPETLDWCRQYFKEKADGWKNDKLIKISKNKIWGMYCESNEIEDPEILNVYREAFPYVFGAMMKLAPERLTGFKYAELNFVQQNPGASFPVHPDIVSKLCSVAIYISPEKGNGTVLCRHKDGSGSYEVPWKVNRALMFCRTNDTWHYYHNTTDHPRDCLVFNLIGDPRT